jgi:calcineurin-like phosphoesterase family protein
MAGRSAGSDGEGLLHDHVHDHGAQRGRMINVGVDATGFRPISAPEVAAIFQRGVMTCDP